MVTARPSENDSAKVESTLGLHVRGLRKTYSSGIVALDNVDFSVESGLYGLLGPNGAGKSTLMRTLATLQPPDAGSFVLDGIDGLAQPQDIRARLGYLPQHVGVYPGASAIELLERFAWLKGRTDPSSRRQEVGVLLEKVNLERDAHRPVSEYSGGMLRRFGIAVALIGKPRLVIVDEPTSGLDPAERNRFHRVLADVGEGAVVLLSTHIVEDIEHLCSHLSIMAKGRIAATGSPQDLSAPLAGRLFSKTFARGESVPDDALRIVASPQGQVAVVEADAAPSDEWTPHVPRLEDAYYAALHAHGAVEEQA